MEDRDPIKQLQHLLDDPGKVLEKISRIQAALGSVKAPVAEAAPDAPISSEAGSVAKTDAETYGSLLQALRDMQSQIEESLRPLAERVVQAETERLRDWIAREHRALDECLARIDQSILACVELIQESKKKHTDLTTLKQRLEEFGAASSALPELSQSQDPGEIINARLRSLREHGKI